MKLSHSILSLKTVFISGILCCALQLQAGSLDSILQTADVAVMGEVIRQRVTVNGNGSVFVYLDFAVKKSVNGGRSYSKQPGLMPGDTIRQLDYQTRAAAETLRTNYHYNLVLSRAYSESGWRMHSDAEGKFEFGNTQALDGFDTVYYADTSPEPGIYYYHVNTSDDKWKICSTYSKNDSLMMISKTRSRGKIQLSWYTSYHGDQIQSKRRVKSKPNSRRFITWWFRRNGKIHIARRIMIIPPGKF